MKKTKVNIHRNPRIIAGSAKGTQLLVSPSARVRPTSLRLRESLFGMLDSLEADYSYILDLYAGSVLSVLRHYREEKALLFLWNRIEAQQQLFE